MKEQYFNKLTASNNSTKALRSKRTVEGLLVALTSNFMKARLTKDSRTRRPSGNGELPRAAPPWERAISQVKEARHRYVVRGCCLLWLNDTGWFTWRQRAGGEASVQGAAGGTSRAWRHLSMSWRKLFVLFSTWVGALVQRTAQSPPYIPPPMPFWSA